MLWHIWLIFVLFQTFVNTSLFLEVKTTQIQYLGWSEKTTKDIHDWPFRGQFEIFWSLKIKWLLKFDPQIKTTNCFKKVSILYTYGGQLLMGTNVNSLPTLIRSNNLVIIRILVVHMLTWVIRWYKFLTQKVAWAIQVQNAFRYLDFITIIVYQSSNEQPSKSLNKVLKYFNPQI